MSGAATAAPDAPLTHRRVLAIAGPIVLSNATIPLLGAVDLGVIGQSGEAALMGAVGLGAVILSSLYWVFGFLRMGTSGLIAQARGARDGAAEAAHLARATLIGAGAGLAMVLLQGPLIALALAVAPGSAEVEAATRSYLGIRIWGAPATVAMYALTGWMIATERTRLVLAVQMVVNGVNILLDLLFVLSFGWGVEGVAAATLTAELAGLALALACARAPLAQGLRQAGLMRRAALAELARLNGDILIRSVLLQASFTTFVFLSAGAGDVVLAANQTLTQFLSITAFALDGFAFAAESLVGQAVGARDPARAARAARLASIWGAAGALALAGVFAVGGGPIIDLLTTSPEVRETARLYLPWLALAPLAGVASWMFDGIFIGATLTAAMRAAMLRSVALYALALAVLVPLWGNHGLWAALTVLNVARGVTMARRYPLVARAAGARPAGTGA